MTKSIEQSVKDKLKLIAQQSHVPFNEIWRRLVMERFLARLARSDHRTDFVFKGGHLLAQYIDLRRETKDLDFLVRNIGHEVSIIEAAFHKILKSALEDGFTFTDMKISPLPHDNKSYPGFRFTMQAHLGQTRTKLQVDVGFGDPIVDKTLKIRLLKTAKKPIFEDEISIQVYPPEAIFAEKLEAAVEKGSANSRMKDYHDLFLMIQANILEPAKLVAAIQKTFQGRDSAFIIPPLSFSESGTAELNATWQAHLTLLGEQTVLPRNIADVIDAINQYVEHHFQ